MTRFAAALLVFCAALPALVRAQDNTVVVELFTSQGCSSCPPADALFERLSQRDDVIALALHVDYWDYIGWKDEYAKPGFTKRQKAYAYAAGRRSIYTPQMIVNGEEDLVGVRGMELAELIMTHKLAPRRVRLDLLRDSTVLTIQLAPLAEPLTGPFDVHLVRYDPIRRAHITRGENAGRVIDYSNVAAEWTVLGQWDGASEVEMQADLPGALPAAVLVQKPGPGAIVAAAKTQ